MTRSHGSIRVGTTVRLRPRHRTRRGEAQTSRVEMLLTGVQGGVALDAPLEGFRFWNVKDLLRVPASRPRKAGRKLRAAAVAAAQQALLQEVQEAEGQAHRLGLHITARALNNAMNALGWEMAGDAGAAGRAARGERPMR